MSKKSKEQIAMFDLNIARVRECLIAQQFLEELDFFDQALSLDPKSKEYEALKKSHRDCLGVDVTMLHRNIEGGELFLTKSLGYWLKCARSGSIQEHGNKRGRIRSTPVERIQESEAVRSVEIFSRFVERLVSEDSDYHRWIALYPDIRQLFSNPEIWEYFEVVGEPNFAVSYSNLGKIVRHRSKETAETKFSERKAGRSGQVLRKHFTKWRDEYRKKNSEPNKSFFQSNSFFSSEQERFIQMSDVLIFLRFLLNPQYLAKFKVTEKTKLEKHFYFYDAENEMYAL